MGRFFVLISIFYVLGQSAMAQSEDIYKKYDIYRSPFRVFLNKFSWTVTTGYAATNYKHTLSGFYFFQDANSQLILSNKNEVGSIFDGYGGWLNNPYSGSQSIDNQYDVPYSSLSNPVNNPALKSDQVLIDTDTASLTFAGVAPTIPVLVSVHYNFNKFRLGAGFQYEQHFMRPLKPSIMKDQIRSYTPGFNTHYTKFFGILGYQFYEYWNHTFVLELQVGKANAGKQINTTAVGIGQNFFANLGVSIEKNFSEYFRLIVKPSYDFKGYTIDLPDGSYVRHTNRAFMIQVGLSVNIPEISRSPIKSDHVQLKHVITDPKSGRLREVRGQPIWKVQNPKVGENHRRLWRYKLKNRGKIDPY